MAESPRSRFRRLDQAVHPFQQSVADFRGKPPHPPRPNAASPALRTRSPAASGCASPSNTSAATTLRPPPANKHRYPETPLSNDAPCWFLSPARATPRTTPAAPPCGSIRNAGHANRFRAERNSGAARSAPGCHMPPRPHSGQGNGLPRGKSRPISNRCASRENSRRTTCHSSAKPKANRNNLFSFMDLRHSRMGY